MLIHIAYCLLAATYVSTDSRPIAVGLGIMTFADSSLLGSIYQLRNARRKFSDGPPQTYDELPPTCRSSPSHNRPHPLLFFLPCIPSPHLPRSLSFVSLLYPSTIFDRYAKLTTWLLLFGRHRYQHTSWTSTRCALPVNLRLAETQSWAEDFRRKSYAGCREGESSLEHPRTYLVFTCHSYTFLFIYQSLP
jgi:hypothetical protein